MYSVHMYVHIKTYICMYIYTYASPPFCASVCYGVMQCVAVCGSVVLCSAVWCSVVQCDAMLCSVCCSVLQYVAGRCSALQSVVSSMDEVCVHTYIYRYVHKYRYEKIVCMNV